MSLIAQYSLICHTAMSSLSLDLKHSFRLSQIYQEINYKSFYVICILFCLGVRWFNVLVFVPYYISLAFRSPAVDALNEFDSSVPCTFLNLSRYSMLKDVFKTKKTKTFLRSLLQTSILLIQTFYIFSSWHLCFLFLQTLFSPTIFISCRNEN